MADFLFFYFMPLNAVFPTSSLLGAGGDVVMICSWRWPHHDHIYSRNL